MVSLVLVSSDVLRSGIGISDMRKHYPALQPDEVLGFGTSWNYTVFKATKSDAADPSTTATVWGYKFDSTSIVWRTFASHLNAPDFPECLHYRMPCPDPHLSGKTAFTMIDSLVNAIIKTDNKTRSGPSALTIRSESEYIDRLHQFLLPRMFINMLWRTNQALYYSAEQLAHTSAAEICFPRIGRRTSVLRFCHELWTNFNYSCAPDDVQCRDAGLIYVHTMQRVRQVQARFPDLSVDLTFLESQEDLQVNRGGISAVGFRRSDVSTIIRARKCVEPTSCETLYVHDYRYETGFLISDVVQWYRLVAMLRVVGQSYFWMRIIGLVLSCYFIQDPGETRRQRVEKTRQLFMKIPSQCVVYGSPFPIACYVLAHLLDAPFTYNILESNFFSQAGVLHINIESFISYAVVQMRNLWVYALLWLTVVHISTARWAYRGSQFTGGVFGLPEFLLSVFSSITLSAQYRSTSFRSSNVLRTLTMPNNLHHAWVPIKYQYSFVHRGRGNILLGGVIIDLKFLVCMALVVAGIWIAYIVAWECRAAIHGETDHKQSKFFIFAPTPVPYSAGALWPTTSLCAHWTSDYFCIHPRLQGPWQELYNEVKQKHKKGNGWVVPFGSCLKRARIVVDASHANKYKYNQSCTQAETKLSRSVGIHPLVFIQHQLKCLHGRGDDVEATVAFMNAVLMSDPLVFLHLRYGRSHWLQLAYYQSLLRPHQVVLLPVAVVGEHNEYTRNLKLLRRVNASQLSWSELVQCG